MLRLPFGGTLEVLGALDIDAESHLDLEEPWEAPPLATLVKASGPAQLGGAELSLWAACPAPGSTFTLLEAESVSGTFSDEEGKPITDGTVLPGSPDGCGEGKPSVGVAIHYTTGAVTATAQEAPTETNGGGAGTPSGGGTGSGSGTPPGTPAPKSGIDAFQGFGGPWLAADLRGAASRAGIAALLRAGGELLHLSVPAAGTPTLLWQVRRGGRSISIGAGSMHLGAGGRGVLHLRLTRRGRALLRKGRRLRGTVRALYQPPGQAPVVQSGSLLLTR